MVSTKFFFLWMGPTLFVYMPQNFFFADNWAFLYYHRGSLELDSPRSPGFIAACSCLFGGFSPLMFVKSVFFVGYGN